jgi:hypothetical protein
MGLGVVTNIAAPEGDLDLMRELIILLDGPHAVRPRVAPREAGLKAGLVFPCGKIIGKAITFTWDSNADINS